MINKQVFNIISGFYLLKKLSNWERVDRLFCFDVCTVILFFELKLWNVFVNVATMSRRQKSFEVDVTKTQVSGDSENGTFDDERWKSLRLILQKFWSCTFKGSQSCSSDIILSFR